MKHPPDRHISLQLAVCTAVIASALSAGGCSRPAGASSAEAPLPQPTTNVVIFLIDTLRADKLGAYGYGKPTSPTIDALAAEGVVFERAQAPAPWTLPSVPSIQTSTFLCEHGVGIEGQKLSPQIPTLAERFKRIAYATGNFYSNNFAGPLTNMHRGFDLCQRAPQFFTDGTHITPWLDSIGTTPYYLYIHNLEPHNPHQAPPQLISLFGATDPSQRRVLGRLLGQYRALLRAAWDAKVDMGTIDNTAEQDAVLARLHAMLDDHLILYDAMVRLSDLRVGSVIDALKRRGDWDDTLFILTADHGEEFAEHGGYLHSQSVYGELTHVPLIIKFPKGAHAGTRVPRVVSLVDILPTVFDVLGRPDLVGNARGASLLPLVRGEPGARDEEPFVISTVRLNERKYYRPWAQTRGERNLALHTPDGRWKGIWNTDPSINTFELYDLQADPTEQHNVCADHPELVAAMSKYVQRWYRSCAGDAKTAEFGGLSEEDQKGLEALGYLGGGGEDEDEDNDKPPPARQPPATGPSAESSATGGGCPVEPLSP